MTDTTSNFAEKLNTLFETITKPDGSHYSQEEVVRGTGGVLTRVYLWKLRKGRAKNPGYNTIEAIAAFFGVDPSYFFAKGATEVGDIESARGEELLNQISLRSSHLDNEGRQALLHMIDYILSSKDTGDKPTKE